MARDKKTIVVPKPQAQKKEAKGTEVTLVDPLPFPMGYTNNAKINFNNWDAFDPVR